MHRLGSGSFSSDIGMMVVRIGHARTRADLEARHASTSYRFLVRYIVRRHRASDSSSQSWSYSSRNTSKGIPSELTQNHTFIFGAAALLN